MAARATPSLPSGVLAPLTVNNHEDRGGLIIVVSALCLSVTLVLLVIRAYIQSIRRTIKLDDILLLGANVLFCIQSSFVFFQAHSGWGKTDKLLRVHHHDPMLKAAYIADILYILTLYVAKCSGSFFYLRISASRILLFAVWSIVSVATTWMAASVLLLGLRCDTRHPWMNITAKCGTLFLRWELIGGIDMIIELAIAGASIILVHDIQITNKRKSQVILALSSRILVLIPATLHLYYLHRQLHSADPSYDGSYTTICAQIQLAYVLVANTIPCLKPFIAAYEGSDAKLTFRGHSPSPRHSGVHSQDDEKDNNQNKQEWPSTSNRPLPRQHRRKGSGQSLLPLHASRTSIENHQHRICVEKPKSACFSPVTTAQGALERKAKLSPLMEHAGSLRWSLASDNSPKTTPLEKLSINDGG